METATGRIYEKKKTIFRTYQIVWYVLSVIEVLLGLRVLLRFLAANPGNPFASFIYALSGVFSGPFMNIFPPITSGRSVLETSTLFAMVVYWLVAWGLMKVFQLTKPVEKDEVIEKVDDPKVRI